MATIVQDVKGCQKLCWYRESKVRLTCRLPQNARGGISLVRTEKNKHFADQMPTTPSQSQRRNPLSSSGITGPWSLVCGVENPLSSSGITGPWSLVYGVENPLSSSGMTRPWSLVYGDENPHGYRVTRGQLDASGFMRTVVPLGKCFVSSPNKDIPSDVTYRPSVVTCIACSSGKWQHWYTVRSGDFRWSTQFCSRKVSSNPLHVEYE